VEGSPSFVAFDGRRTVAEPPAFPAAVLAAPRLQLPHRAYLVFAGYLSTLAALTADPADVWRQSPNLFWPCGL
jgi:hypothetical protein